jgi:CDP-6-deoxy-D-xylo-4-hexulose-3-dehydrase
MDRQGRQVTVGDFRATPKEIEYVNQVLTTGRLSYGPFSKQFEKLWAEAHEVKHAIFSNSGTSALHIAVQALKTRYKWADGDEVIVPSVTFVATANVVIHNNLKPVFVDVDPDTYNIDPSKIEDAITARTRAIIPVHLLGLPAEMPKIMKIASRYGLNVIEDACETAFAECHGKPVGSWGDIGCFSTYMAHYIVTGVGGVNTTNNPILAVDLRSLMNHGRDSIYLSIDDDNDLSGDKFREVISKRFSFVECGHSFRCTEMEAALGVGQLERYGSIIRDRKLIAAKYTAGLADLTDVLQLPTTPPGLEHVFMLYPIVVRGGEKKDLVECLETHGIETRDLLPLLGQPVYRRMFGNQLRNNPVAARLDQGGFYIGCHQYITNTDIEHVLDTIYAFYGRKRKQS